MGKCLPTMRETRVQSLGGEDLLEKEMATHSSILAWKIPWTEKPGGLQSMGSQRVGHDWVTSLTFSFPYRTPGKTTRVTRRTFAGKVISLLSNMLSRLVIAFLPRSKHLLISWLQSLSTVILEPKKIVCHHFHCFLIYLPWSDGTKCMILVFWMLSFKPAFSLSFPFNQEAL